MRDNSFEALLKIREYFINEKIYYDQNIKLIKLYNNLVLFSNHFLLSYKDGEYSISFSLNTPPDIAGIFVNKLTQFGRINVTKSYYYDEDNKKIFWGNEANLKYTKNLIKVLSVANKAINV